MPLTGGVAGYGAAEMASAVEVLPGAWIHAPAVLGETREQLRWNGPPRLHPDGTSSCDASPARGVAGPTASLILRPRPDLGQVQLEWQLRWTEASVAAMEFPHSVAIAKLDEHSLLLPGLHYGWESVLVSPDHPTYGQHPRLDPALGFGVRADRLPQVAVITGDADRSWALFTPTETPTPPHAGMLFSVFARAVAPDRLLLGLRYPQAEHGHDHGGELAYVAKGVVGHGEDRRIRWSAEDRLTVRMELLSLPGPPKSHVGVVPRRLWEGVRPEWHGSLPPGTVASERARWTERHLWNAGLGQYESPEGSGTALAGFVEMSLTLACVLARLGSLSHGSDADGASAKSAIGDWLRDGVDSAGRLLPIRDQTGFHAGRRRYDADPGDDLTWEPLIESIRPSVECRSILGLLRRPPSWLQPETCRAWRRQLVRVAGWLASQRRDGVLPALVGGPTQQSDGRGSAHLIALLGDLAQDMPDHADAESLLSEAEETYQRSVAHLIERREFGGVTLDAACPDREAVAAALEASLVMYEATSDERYLRDAEVATNTLLTYVYAYPIGTFEAATDASERGISTLGASLVSAENQHLDPYPVGPMLVRYGLYADDAEAIAAGLANTSWCLDGRWAIIGADGIKQPEQFCHTAWHYDAHFTRRGDFRRGMPIHGRPDSEHGWAQALPIAALLEQGHATLDWPTGRIASLPGWEARAERRRSGFIVEVSGESADASLESQVLLRVLRPPRGQEMRISTGGSGSLLSWPASLVSLPVDASNPSRLSPAGS